jgi:membrane protein implicated in regulation of membrane protease activity
LFAALALVSMFTVRRRLYEMLRGQAVGIGDSATGAHITVREPVAPGASCRAEYRGTEWTAINVGGEVIPAGGTAEIAAIDGLNLQVKLIR